QTGAPGPQNGDCLACHDDAGITASDGRSITVVGSVFADSIHGPMACTDCHGRHDSRSSSDKVSRTYPLNLPATCGTCHGDAKIIKDGGIRIGDVFAKYHDSIHGKALEKSGLLVSAKCTDCH